MQAVEGSREKQGRAARLNDLLESLMGSVRTWARMKGRRKYIFKENEMGGRRGEEDACEMIESPILKRSQMEERKKRGEGGIMNDGKREPTWRR